MPLAGAIPGIDDLTGYGIVGALMAIIVGGAAVIIVALWRELAKERAKNSKLNELLLAEVRPAQQATIGTLETVLGYLLAEGRRPPP